MIEIVDYSGLICAFRLPTDRAAEPLNWTDVTQGLDSEKLPVWIHLDGKDQRIRHWLERNAGVPRLARELLLDHTRRLRLEAIDDGLMGVIGDVQHDFDGELSTIGMLHFHLSQKVLMTLRHEPLSALDNLRRAVSTGALRVADPVDLLVHLLHELAGSLGTVIAELTETIDEIEDNLLEHKVLTEAGELARVRRDLARLRRHLVPQRQALSGILNLMPSWFTAGHATGVQKAVERLAAAGGDLESLREQAALLQNELSSRLAEMTNHNLYLLSIVTAVFLPLTLITGIFGMNTGGLPWLQDSLGFWWVMGLMGLTVVITFVLLAWRRLF